jgi:glycosyltransferase involved in cell wall biosynthesis
LAKHSLAPPYLLFVGDLHPRKNIERLIECHNMIRKEERTSVQLVLVGKKLWKYDKIMKTIRVSPYRNAIKRIDYVSLEDLRAISGKQKK